MMRSHAVTFIFVSSRVPLAFPAISMSVEQLTTFLWYLIVMALVVPDLPAVCNALRRTRNEGDAGRGNVLNWLVPAAVAPCA